LRIFDFSLKVNGFDIDKAKVALSKIQAQNDLEFEAYIALQKNEIVSYHLEHNSFYKSFGTTIDKTIKSGFYS
jgi:phenylacetate-CoA ligase